MESPLKEMVLANGHILQFHDHTRRYFGNYYLVKIEITCQFTIQPYHFENEDAFIDARKVVGNAVTFRKTVEHMGIESDRLDQVKEEVINNFISHSMPYIETSDFPAKFITGEYRQRKNKIRRLF